MARVVNTEVFTGPIHKNVPTERCKEPSCTQPTSERKPYCIDHMLSRSLYLKGLLETLHRKEQEIRVASDAWKHYVRTGIICNLAPNDALTSLEEEILLYINSKKNALKSESFHQLQNTLDIPPAPLHGLLLQLIRRNMINKSKIANTQEVIYEITIKGVTYASKTWRDSSNA